MQTKDREGSADLHVVRPHKRPQRSAQNRVEVVEYRAVDPELKFQAPAPASRSLGIRIQDDAVH